MTYVPGSHRHGLFEIAPDPKRPVHHVPQTGDPTLYQFDFRGETSVVVKWRHDYALTVQSLFSSTESVEKDAAGNPIAGATSTTFWCRLCTEQSRSCR